MNIKFVKKQNLKDWDNFIDSSNNGTIFHKLKFLSYHKDKYTFCNLEVYEKNKLIAVLPGEIKNNVYKSPVGASYGSFITEDLSLNKMEEVIDTFLGFLKSKKIKEIYLTTPPIFYKQKINQQEDFLLLYKGFLPISNLITHALNLSCINTENPLDSFEKRFRTAVRLSLKSDITVKNMDNFNDFYPILVSNKSKFDAKPAHKKEELEKLKELFPKEINLLMAYKDSIPIAGIAYFICNSKTALIFYIAQDYQFHSLNPVSRLIYEIIVRLKKEHYSWLDFGVSMDTLSKNPMEPSRNLIFFKESVKSRGFLRTTYYKKV